ncbi:hypothetical protein ACSSV4_000895 [Roseovarius sp. MBR-154]|jgi:hypothetical protein
MGNLNLSTTHFAFGGVVAAAALIAGGFWYVEHLNKTRLYTEAAADCRNGTGAGKLLALDDQYGIDARPKDLFYALSDCAHEYRMERIRYLQGLRDALSD